MRVVTFLFALLAVQSVFAGPKTLVIDGSVKPKTSDKYISGVHKEITPSSDNINAIRYGILEGMLQTRGYKWAYEGEGEGYILARFDYRGDTNVMRIEYNENLVQLKYERAFGDYVCKKLIDGICYKNGRGYYKYVRNLRKSLAQQLSVL